MFGLVAMTTNYIMSCDWSRGLVHNMNTSAYVDLLFWGKKWLQTFYSTSHKIQVFTLKKAKLRANSNCSSLQEGRVTISWARVAKKPQVTEIEDTSSLYQNTSFNDSIRTAINHGTSSKPTNLKLSFRCTKSNMSSAGPLVNVLYYTRRCSLAPTSRLCLWNRNVLSSNWQEASNTGSLDIPRFWIDARDVMCLVYVTMSKVVYATVQFKPVAEGARMHPTIPCRRRDLSNTADEVLIL